MSKNFLNKAILEAPVGYALHKIICDSEGVPCDYKFISINDAFEELTGLYRENVLGKLATEVIPDIKSSKFDWINNYGHIAIHGGVKEFEQFSEYLNKWYRVKAYSPEKYYFAVYFTDISNEMRKINALKNLVSFTDEFLQMNEGGIDYQKITDDFLLLTNAKYAVFNLFDVDGKSFTTKALSGDKGDIKKACKLIGMNIVGNQWDPDFELEEKIKGSDIIRFSALSDFAGYLIPKTIINIIENKFNIGEVILIKILKNEIVLGDFTLFMEKGIGFDLVDVALLYTNQLGMFITRKRMERALKESEKKYSSYIENAPYGVFIANENWRFIEVNKAASDITGYNRDELLGMSISDILAEESVIDGLRRFEDLKKSGSIHETFKYSHKNGRYRWWTVDAVKFSDTLFLGYSKDVTDQRHAEIQLQQSEERFQLLFNKAPLGYQSLDYDGNFINVNQQWLDTLGYSYEEVIGEWFGDFLATQYKEVFLERFPIFLKQGYIHSEFEMIHKEGKLLYIAFEGKIAYDSNGQFVQTHCILQDITEKKKVENELIASEERYKFLFEYSGVAIGYYTVDGIVISYNRKAAENMGARDDDFRGISLYQLFAKEDADAYMRRISLAASTNGSQEYEDKISINNNYKWFLSTYNRILDSDNHVVGVQIVSQDITERKTAENNLKHLSFHDSLTGLYNRRFFEEELKRLDTKRNHPLTIVMGDVNGLKIINDSLGHNMGDELLIKAADAIKLACREDDIIARIGGDEFVLLLPRTDALQAKQVIEHVKDIVSKQNVGSVMLSISFGHETKKSSSTNIQEVLAKAENDMYRHKMYENASLRSKTIDMIMNTLYEKSSRELFHSKRVGELCEAIAIAMQLDKDSVSQIKVAGFVHDIGKIGVSETILNKDQPLTGNEWAEIKKHPVGGWRILSSVNDFSELAKFVLEHHERWDGEGYPNGLKGTEISLEARIITVADSYDAMTSARSYRYQLSKDAAINEIKKSAGTQLDPDVSRTFVLKVLKKEW